MSSLGLPDTIETDSEFFTCITIQDTVQNIWNPIEKISHPIGTLFERINNAKSNDEKVRILSNFLDDVDNYEEMLAKVKGHLIGSRDLYKSILLQISI